MGLRHDDAVINLFPASSAAATVAAAEAMDVSFSAEGGKEGWRKGEFMSRQQHLTPVVRRMTTGSEDSRTRQSDWRNGTTTADINLTTQTTDRPTEE